MSKINQIQTRLKEKGEGAFETLANVYLHRKGYEHINPLGSVIGSDKTRVGTPDTFVPLPNGKYMFAEHTTQKTGIFNKFKDDLQKCLDNMHTQPFVGKQKVSDPQDKYARGWFTFHFGYT